MARLVAPYNNGMRLGQGFNSYTQQCCLNGAVLQAKAVDSAVVDDRPSTSKDDSQRRVSQIVSYSSRFVDKLSDVVDAMNISASLSIKTATIGGKANGQFIDSDKFKESDMNFYVQVKVTNQIIEGEDFTEFVNLGLNPSQFNEVYGDCFISGWEEGGQLDALISVKVLDKNKTFSVKAELEASLGTPALSGEIKGGINMENSAIKNSTETTMTVNWSGGGQIKPRDAIWNVNTLTLAASNFPELVMETPQRTYAILTKYTALKTFHKCQAKYSPLAYENAGVYTSALLDSYMEYKSLWKQIHLANYELKIRQADMRQANPIKEILQLMTGQTSVSRSGSSEQSLVTIDHTDPKGTSTGNVPTTIVFEPYQPNVLGLDKARRDCRNEMTKIVREVDEVTKDPDLALDSRREDRLISPRVFSQLLPVVIRRAPNSIADRDQIPADPVILGEVAENLKVFNRDSAPKCPVPFGSLLTSIKSHMDKDKTFDMGSTWSGASDSTNDSIFFNDLDIVNDKMTPTNVALWIQNDLIRGLRTVYSTGKQIEHGNCQGEPSKVMSVLEDGSIGVIQMTLQSCQSGRGRRVRSICVVDTANKVQEYPSLSPVPSGLSSQEDTLMVPPSKGLWSFRGFWGSLITEAPGGFDTLGIVWGADSAETRLKAATLAEVKLYTGAMALPPDALASIEKHRERAARYRMTPFVGDPDLEHGTTYWNDLDKIQDSWCLRNLTIYYDRDKYLTGYLSTYDNGETIKRGSCDGASITSDDFAKTNANGDQTGFSQVWIRSALEPTFEVPIANHIRLLDNNVSWFEVTPKLRAVDQETGYYGASPGVGWVLGGFWGHCGSAIDRIGVIWMKIV